MPWLSVPAVSTWTECSTCVGRSTNHRRKREVNRPVMKWRHGFRAPLAVLIEKHHTPTGMRERGDARDSA